MGCGESSFAWESKVVDSGRRGFKAGFRENTWVGNTGKEKSSLEHSSAGIISRTGGGIKENQSQFWFDKPGVCK